MLVAELHSYLDHYARLSKNEGQTRLLKGLDQGKDQSYFLHAVDEQAFSRSLFPVGELQKSEVRKIAAEQGFVTHDKKDSTGICFIGERRFKDFLETYIPAQKGSIKSIDGQTVGDHDGLMFYTLGQRQGLNIGGVKGAPEAPWYVIDKDVVNNCLIVGQGIDNPQLYSEGLTLSNLHFINAELDIENFRCSAKTRYRQQDQECSVVKQEQGWKVSFEEKQRAVTPGQSIVFYTDDHCLGGGVIEATI
ncbi:UNVERIFIED_CONTAM: hypothetical protein GTU68_040459 [Idotea baltica]|nr:hypothetical protein [Idotea baltica]